MNLLIFVIMSVLIMSITEKMLNDKIRPLIYIESKLAYLTISVVFVVILGIVIFSLVHVDENAILSGVIFGFFEAIMKLCVVNQKKDM